MNPPETFHTARLLLRKPRPEDAPLIFAAYGQDAEVTRYLMWHPHQAVSETQTVVERLLAAWRSEAEFSWLLFTRPGGELVGAISARPDGHRINLGYVLARSHWNQGLMTEALQAVVQWAFAEPSVFRVWAVCDTENSASARVLEKAGLRREGILRQWALHPNLSAVPRDCYSYARTRNA